MKNNKNLGYQLYLIIFLILIFFAIIVLATTNRNVDTTYQFIDEITISQQLSNNKIGEVLVENHGFIGSRVKLKSLVGCTFEDSNRFNEIYIMYLGTNLDYFNSRNQNTIDLGGKENKTLSIIIDYFPILFKEKITIDEENYSLYIFETRENQFSFCTLAQKEDAIKIINVNVK